MPEMELIIKPKFEEQAVDKFARDVNQKIGAASASSSSGGNNKEMKEQEKQTNLLSGLLKVSKFAAATAAIAKAVPYIATGVSRAIVGDEREQLAQALESGEQKNKFAAEAVRKGEELNQVLDTETVLREYLEQQALYQQTNDGRHLRNMRILETVWVDLNKQAGINNNNIIDISKAANDFADLSELRVKKVWSEIGNIINNVKNDLRSMNDNLSSSDIVRMVDSVSRPNEGGRLEYGDNGLNYIYTGRG